MKKITSITRRKLLITLLCSGMALFVAPPIVSLFLKPEPCDETLDVVIAQPNIDPYNKFGGMTQEEQNE